MRFFRILLAIITSLVALPFVALVIVSILPERTLIRLTENSVEQLTDYRLRVDGPMEIRVWELEPFLSVSDFEVDKIGTEGPIFSSKLSRIRLDLLSTIMGEPTLAGVQLDGSRLHISRMAPRKEPISESEVDRTLRIPFLQKVSIKDFKIFYSESQYPKSPGIFIKSIHLGSDDAYETRSLQGNLSIAESEFLIKGTLSSHHQMQKGDYYGSVGLRSKPDGNHKIDLKVESMANPGSYSIRLEGKGPDLTPYTRAIGATFEGGTIYDFRARSVWLLKEQVMKISDFSLITSFVDVSVAGQLDYKQLLRATINMEMRNFDLEFFREKFTDLDSGSLERRGEPRKLLDDEPLPILPLAYIPLGSFDIELNFKEKPLLARLLVERDRLLSLAIKDVELMGADGPHFQGRGELSIENQIYHLSGNITVPGYDLSGLNHIIKSTVEDESKVDIFNDQTAIAGKVFLQQQFSTFGSSIAGLGDHLSGKGVAAVEDGHIHSIIIEPLNLDILESAASIIADNSVIEMECSYGETNIENGVLKFEEGMVGTQDSNIFIKGLIDFKKQGLWIRFFPKVKDKSITGINEKILISGPIHEPSLGLYRDGKEVTDTSVWDWASSFFQGMFENVQDLISDPNLEPMKSGICEDYRQRIDAAKGKVLSH